MEFQQLSNDYGYSENPELCYMAAGIKLKSQCPVGDVSGIFLGAGNGAIVGRTDAEIAGW